MSALEHPRSRRNFVVAHPFVVAWLFAFTIGTSWVVVGLYRVTYGYWGRLEDAAARFGEVNDMEFVSQQRSGTVVCFVSCGGDGEAKVVAVIAFPGLDELQAGASVSAMIERAFGPPIARGNGSSPWTPVPSVGDRAFVVSHRWCSRVGAAQETRCTVTFVSGIE
jgi:hypothetical protein